MDKEINEEKRVGEGGIWGEEAYGRKGLLFFRVLLDLLGEFEFCSWGRIITGGTGLLGVLGMGARISIWYPGARKQDRLLLAGREETRFGQSWSVASSWAR
jgi:hypothetical protein